MKKLFGILVLAFILFSSCELVSEYRFPKNYISVSNIYEKYVFSTLANGVPLVVGESCDIYGHIIGVEVLSAIRDTENTIVVEYKDATHTTIYKDSMGAIYNIYIYW